MNYIFWEHSRRSLCVFVESLASGFPVKCDPINSIGCNDLISGNSVSYESKTSNCWAFPSKKVFSVEVENEPVTL